MNLVTTIRRLVGAAAAQAVASTTQVAVCAAHVAAVATLLAAVCPSANSYAAIDAPAPADPSGVILDVAISPGGKHVAYTSAEGRVSVLDVATSRSKVLALEAPRPGGIAWSPEGTRLVCVAERKETGGSWDLILVDLVASTQRPFVEHAAREFDPVFAPGGESVYFCSTRGGGSSDIFRYRIQTNEIETVVDQPYDQIRPRVSSDSLKLAYISYETGKPQVYVLDMVNRDRAWMDLNLPEEFGPVCDVDWAPGERYELLVTCRTPSQTTLVRFDVEKEKRKTLLKAPTEPKPLDLARVCPEPAPDLGGIVSPFGRSGAVFIREGHVYYRLGGLRTSRDATDDLPPVCTRVAADAFSGAYAAVLAENHVTIGQIGMAGSRLWFLDEDAPARWADVLLSLEERDKAADVCRALARAGGKRGPYYEHFTALLMRDAGRLEEAWRLSESQFGSAKDADARANAAEALAEMSLFDYGVVEQASRWYQAVADFETRATSSTPVRAAHVLVGELDDESMALYRKGVNEWRSGDHGAGAKAFAKLLERAPLSDALSTEITRLFLPSAYNATSSLFYREALSGLSDPTNPVVRHPSLKHRVRVAEAYIEAGGEKTAETLEWLARAHHAIGDNDKARKRMGELLELGMDRATLDRVFRQLRRYAFDPGGMWLYEGLSVPMRHRIAFENGFVEQVLLSPAVKGDLVVRFVSGPEQVYALAPDLAEMRRAIRRARAEEEASAQRFLMARLHETPEKSKDRRWREAATLATGMTAEAHLGRGNWLDARKAIEMALAYRIGDEEQADDEAARLASRYHYYLTERLSLLFDGAESSTAFGRLMADEADAVRAWQRDPLDTSPKAWERALRNYVGYLHGSEGTELHPVTLCLMANAYKVLGYPRELVIYSLKAALASEPSAPLDAMIRIRLAREFEAQGDPHLARGFLQAAKKER